MGLGMKLGLLYLPFIGVFIAGLVFVSNPYVEYILSGYIRYGDGHTEYIYEIVRSFSLPILLTGVLLTVTSITNTIVLTIVLIVLRIRKQNRKSIADGVNNV
ncbi:MAG: hypothetical protein KGD61_09775 [Candidatus Lokiarchaeota archaeon]|nr:hypothetical protein [Candidatus Lokiarchaeota archaeon]